MRAPVPVPAVIATFVASVLIHAGAPAQTWARSFSALATYTNSFAVAATPDGGSVVGGDRISTGGGWRNSWIARLDRQGNPVWERTFAAAHLACVRSNATSVVAAGSMPSAPGSLASDLWVVVLDGSGNTLWNNQYAVGGGEVAQAIEPTLDGGYIVTGEAAGGRLWVLKLDTLGAPQWQKAFSLNACVHVAGVHVALTADGGFLLSGSILDVCTTNTEPGAVVLKLDALGTRQWLQTFGPGTWLRAGAQARDGGFVLGGSFTASRMGDTTAWIVKLAANGSVVWQRRFDQPSLFGNSIDDLQATPGGGFVGCGTIAHPVPASPAQFQMWVFELDDAGGIVWENEYGSWGFEAAHALAQTAHGGLVVVGSTDSFSPGNLPEAWILALDATGAIPAACPLQPATTAVTAVLNPPGNWGAFGAATTSAVIRPGPVPVSSVPAATTQCVGCFAGVVPVGGTVGGPIAFAHDFSCQAWVVAVTFLSLSGRSNTIVLPGGVSIQLDVDWFTTSFLALPHAFAWIDGQGLGTTPPLQLPSLSSLVGLPVWLAGAAVDLQAMQFVAATPTVRFFLR